MYTAFFGLNEKPFKLVPNPAYLFLSRSHEEALAHLTYALSEGDGFLMITGEVGTGKTTLCRAFLERLEPSVEAALIFNPRLDAVQLLKAINDEFEIDAGADTVKGLVDVFNDFLLRMRAAGRRVVVLIDEAQNLNREVLEQLRLLSNLESTRSKLLQIILVGQPELETMLSAHDLRQLRQRITLACRLRPLGLPEMKRYVHHRLAVAGGRAADLFSPAALRLIHRYADGVPRLINMACDRALLTAFGADHPRVTWTTAWKALREIRGKTGGGLAFGRWSMRLTLGLASAVLLAGLVGAVFLGGLGREEGSRSGSSRHVPAPKHLAISAPDSPPVAAAADAPPSAAVAAPPLAVAGPVVAGILKALDPALSRREALAATLECWGGRVEFNGVFEIAAKDAGFFRMAAVRNGFSLRRMEGTLTDIQHFGLPVLIAMRRPERDGLVYLSMTGFQERIVTCRQSPDRPAFHARWEDLAPFYAGIFYLSWKNPRRYSGVVSAASSREKILELEEHLVAAGVSEAAPAGVYGPPLQAVIRVLQRRHGLAPDGLAGPMTQLALYRETPGYRTPPLQPDQRGSHAGDGPR